MSEPKYFRYIDGQKEPEPQTLYQMFQHEPDWAMSRFRHMEKIIEQLEAEIQWYRDDIDACENNPDFSHHIAPPWVNDSSMPTHWPRKRGEDELEGNMGFRDFVGVAATWLENYPQDIFDGSSGDDGPIFVCAIRAAVRALPPEEET